MTELERKALMGDREAQKQLTESGILCEAVALVLSGELDKLEEDAG